MRPRPDCPDCGGRMQEGFVPDETYGRILQTHFYEGSAETQTFLGIATGLKLDEAHMHPIRAFRCAECGLVRLYA